MKNEKVSIVLPTYNRAHTLKKAVDSILAQSYPHFELLIVDDGSTDGTKTLIEGYEDDRIRYCYAGLNQGAAAARNFGIERAECEYIAFEDSDDIWYPTKLEKQMNALREAGEETGFVYHKISYDMGNHCCAILPSEKIPLEQKSGDIYAQLLYDNLVPCPAILARRCCIEAAGGFDTELKALEDYDYALKMAKHYKAVFLDEVLLEAAYSCDGVSGNAVNYLLASCRLIQKYKADYLATDTFNHRVEIILRDSQAIGMQEQFVGLLEQMLQAEG